MTASKARRGVSIRPKDQAKLNKVMRKEFDALSITMPLKSFGVEICDEIDEVATHTQSVNSLRSSDGKLLGAPPTDDRNALRGQFDASPEGPVVVLGAGARRGPCRRTGSPRRRVGAVHGETKSGWRVVARYKNVYDFSLLTGPLTHRHTTRSPVELKRRRHAGVGAQRCVDITYERACPPGAHCRTLGCASATGWHAGHQARCSAVVVGRPIDARNC